MSQGARVARGSEAKVIEASCRFCDRRACRNGQNGPQAWASCAWWLMRRNPSRRQAAQELHRPENLRVRLQPEPAGHVRVTTPSQTACLPACRLAPSKTMKPLGIPTRAMHVRRPRRLRAIDPVADVCTSAARPPDAVNDSENEARAAGGWLHARSGHWQDVLQLGATLSRLARRADSMARRQPPEPALPGGLPARNCPCRWLSRAGRAGIRSQLEPATQPNGVELPEPSPPGSFVVLAMREHGLHPQQAAREIDARHRPELVGADVENIALAQLVEVGPGGRNRSTPSCARPFGRSFGGALCASGVLPDRQPLPRSAIAAT